MPVIIDEQYLPARLTAPPMTDAEFEEFCSEHPDFFIEVTADGEILILPPDYWLTGFQSGCIFKQLANWADLKNEGIAIDSSGGFRLPNRLSVLRRKMREWVENGAKLAWLIDPERRAVEVYRPGHEPEILSGLEAIAATAPVDGFTLDVKPVWEPLS